MQNSGRETSLIRQKMLASLRDARSKLLELSLRNKLISTNLSSERARQIAVIGEKPDRVFQLLKSGRSMSFSAQERFEISRSYERNQADPTIRGPQTQELPLNGRRRHENELHLRTRLTPESLEKRLVSLFYEAQTIEEEQGVNVLFLALGFLEWREAAHSDLPRFAPLVLLPIELLRDGAKDRFKVKIRQEDIITNICLQTWLREQFRINLPDIADDDEWKPTEYFAAVQDAIGNRRGWAVQTGTMVAGFFSFAKFLLWRDLDPENWPGSEMLLGNRLLSQILLRDVGSPLEDVPIIGEDARIDQVFPPSDLIHVADADGSQAMAIQEALSGKNLVIQGPPGTGKSQTITNIIAGAVHSGRRVLFIAEKMAALEVVHRRLSKAGLAPICLELHSRKSSKTHVLEQIKQAMSAAPPPRWSASTFSELEDTQAQLWKHSDTNACDSEWRLHAIRSYRSNQSSEG